MFITYKFVEKRDFVDKTTKMWITVWICRDEFPFLNFLLQNRGFFVIFILKG
jgi:hypothetical protein